MLKNLLIVSIRNIKRNKGFTLLNMLGLVVAITISILAIVKIESELSFEKGFANYQRIVRINQDVHISDQLIEAAVTPGAMGPAMPETFPEIESYVRIDRGNGTLKYGEKEFDIEGLIKTDSTIFNFFDIDIIYGDGPSSIQTVEGIALSQSVATQIFGQSNPLGEGLILNGTIPVVVTAVFADLPQKSHLKLNALVSLTRHNKSEMVNSWLESGIFTYLKLTEQADIEQLEGLINDFMFEKTKIIREQTGWMSVFTLMPISEIRLHSHRIGDSGGGSMGHILALLAITLIVVVLAAINYTNLSVALANRRAHEVGMRKIVGSPKRFIVYQFLFESIIISISAFLLALPVAEVSIQAFGNFTGLPLTYGIIENFNITVQFFVFACLLGVLSGIYPAFVLSSFSPLKVIRKGNKSTGRKALFRNVLIVSQFAAGLALIIITVIVFQQREFLMGHSMGVDKDNTIVVRTHNLDQSVSVSTLKSELGSVAGVKAISASEANPPESFSASNFIAEGTDNASILITSMRGDSDLVNSLGINIIEGRKFDASYVTDSTSIIINQKLARQLGWESNAIGKRIWQGTLSEGRQLNVIGVVEDFHFESMHSPIKPLILIMDDRNPQFLIVRLEPGNHAQTINQLKSKWSDLLGEKEMKFVFISDNYNKLYQSEKGMSKGFILLTAIAIFIACLGLVGLATFSTNLKGKEISIRKVMGASTVRLLLMLWWNFIRLIGVATLIAWPIAYLLVNDWLNNFAYRVIVSPWVFILSAVIGVVLALVSVGTITIKAVKQNPAETLKWE
jgi:putative ABC transport system permease protein